VKRSTAIRDVAAAPQLGRVVDDDADPCADQRPVTEGVGAFGAELTSGSARQIPPAFPSGAGSRSVGSTGEGSPPEVGPASCPASPDRGER
jgi:hypothetical protein